MGQPDLLLAYLATHDAPCPVCSYNLRNLAAATCPECGAPLNLQVGSENLHLGPWFVAVVSLALGLGFDGVVATLMTFSLVIFPPAAPLMIWNLGVVLAGFIGLTLVCGGALFTLFRRRPAWNRLGPRRQRHAAAAIFACTFLIHACYGFFVFMWLNR